MDMSNDSSFSGRKAYKRPPVPAQMKSSKVPKDYQNELSYPSWNLSGRPAAASAEVRSKDLSHDNSFASRSSGSRPFVPAPAPVKPKVHKELHLAPMAMKGPSITKRRSAPPNVQPRKPQMLSEERYFQEEDKSSRLVRKKQPKPSSRNAASGDSDGRQRSSGSDEEREAVLYARRSLEQALEKADSLVDQLEKLEDDIEALEDEKVALLDELLVCEGLAVNPYPRFRKRNFIRTKRQSSEP
ncbi:hypothetical protein MPTK1_3g00610 [Marchantia polymorpha subsp. ruderalis]|uniref:Uncharacterized protein n=2 Tax=Marchantia polymorpha TaxID=3197 RepID=A0AAF6AVY0_MARPO|nr:hypothetical protein MARPO_0007s0057 [Marchantia polymorpha]BBN03914.1 hypothetical protein Mp_3g00610 [Marchantia polymorpha subsp. ruderalis]|eukprot:PTQ47602.1 hypothetical protein MARPO_0007s0057 [Marchantia polymorpha]